MKRSRVLVLLALLVMFCGGGVLTYLRVSTQQGPAEEVRAQQLTLITSPVPEPLASAIDPPKAETMETSGKQEHYASLLSRLNHKDIVFYGRVLDEIGTPLEGVQVTACVIYNSGIPGVGSGVQEKVFYTDAQGYFTVKGMSGRTLDYVLKKDGYVSWPEGDAFDYTEFVPEAKRHKPDPKNPVVLKMYKLKGAEPLIYVDQKTLHLDSDGTPIRFDLASAQVVSSGGDLAFEFWHANTTSRSDLGEFDWRFRMQSDGGGFVRTESRLRLFAPEDGYQRVLEVEYKKGDTSKRFAPQYDGYFYVRTKTGQHAVVRVDVCADSSNSPSLVILTYFYNPKPGSRVLEFDREKRILLEGQEPWIGPW